MEREIRYCMTEDGASIAYVATGGGRPLIMMPVPGFSHAELSWQMFPVMAPLASAHRVVTYDARGTGLSDRSAVDFSMEAMLRDLDAVIERTGLESFVLASWATAAPIAIKYAATHSARVSHLILCDGWASFPDLAESTAYKTGLPLLDTDWVLFTEAFSQVLWAYANPEFGRLLAEFIRECIGPEAMRAVWKAWEGYDVTEFLSRVASPTLVVQNKNSRWYSVDVGRRLAAAIPDARLTLIDDITYDPVPGLIMEFVGDPSQSVIEDPAPRLPSDTAIILFADIVDSTRLTEQLGDTAFRERARQLDDAMRKAIRDANGTPIEGKLLGDGVLAVFTAARDAISGAIACREASQVTGLELHLGIHAGDVIREDNNVYGGAVNIASRISGLSAPGEVLVSDIVRGLARTSAAVRFEDRGEHTLKGIDDPVRVFAVRTEGA